MPVISKITGAPFRFWCQKILPAVYDDSLSYYELLCKVVDYLNKVMEDDINVVNLVNELEEFVNNYFDNLDVQQEINNKLDAMAQDGSLLAVIAPHLDPIIEDYEATLDADLAEYKETIDDDVADFKSTVNTALTAQDTDISNFKNTVNGQLSAQNTDIATFKSNISTAVGQQDSDISVMQSQMSNFLNSYSDIQTFTDLYTASSTNGLHYINQTIDLSHPYTDYEELDIYWSYNSDKKVIRVKSADLLADGVYISWYVDKSPDTSIPAPLYIALMKLVNGNTAHTQLTLGEAYSEEWNGIAASDATRDKATTASEYTAGEVYKIVGITYTTSAELTDIRVAYNGLTYSSAGDSVRGQTGNISKAVISTYEQDNLLKYVNFTEGKFRNAQDGSYVSNAQYCYSSPVYVKPNTNYTLSTAYHTCYLDANGAFISGQYASTNFVTPANCYFVQVSPPIAEKASATLTESVRGDVYSKMICGNSTDLLSNNVYEDGYFYAYNTGNRTSNANYCNTGVINVGADTPIAMFGVNGPHTCFYDKNMTYISGSLFTYFKTPANCVYMRTSFPIADKINALVKRFDREDRIKVGSSGQDYFTNLSQAVEMQSYCDKPIYVYGGTYDLSAATGRGLNPTNDIIGIGLPKIFANKNAFDINFSLFNITKSIKLEGLLLEANNCRYCVHIELGDNAQRRTIKIKDCVLTQNTEPQAEFTYPRAIGVGLGDGSQLIVEGCIMSSNAPTDIDCHTGYNGQTDNAYAIIKDCVMSSTASATYAGVTGSYVDTVVVSNCKVSAVPYVIGTTDTINMIQYNNDVSN